MSEKYLSRSAFAARQTWSPSYVTKLGHQGRLVLCPENPKLIDVGATLAALLCTGDPGGGSLRKYHASMRVEKHVSAHVKIDSATDDIAAPVDVDPKYWDSKTRREAALANLTELELAVKSGHLVNRQRVEDVAFRSGRMLRDAGLGIPTQLAPVFASMTDAVEIEAKFSKALHQIFADFEKMASDDLSRVADLQ